MLQEQNWVRVRKLEEDLIVAVITCLETSRQYQRQTANVGLSYLLKTSDQRSLPMSTGISRLRPVPL